MLVRISWGRRLIPPVFRRLKISNIDESSSDGDTCFTIGAPVDEAAERHPG